MYRTLRSIRMRSMIRLLVLATVVLAPSIRAVSGEPSPSGAGTSPSSQNGVRVQILEGLEDERSWDFSSTPVITEEYFEPAFGLITIPRKYGEGGNIFARPGPFLLRASARVRIPPGTYHVLLRSFGGARLRLDGEELTRTRFTTKNKNGHEEVPELPGAFHAALRPLPPGHAEKLLRIEFSGRSHSFEVDAIVGGRKLRPELGELCLALARVDPATGKTGPFQLLAPHTVVALDDRAWTQYAKHARIRQRERNRTARLLARRPEDAYWRARHRQARDYVDTLPPILPPTGPKLDHFENPIDRFVGERLLEAGRKPTGPIDDWAFLRRVTLDVRGVLPTPQEALAFTEDADPQRRRRYIDHMLASGDWADHWVSYWQDVLAENPGLVKPKLNNTGPFRWWIHEALEDNLSIDRFATELIRMRGSRYHGGPAGFAMATQNDAPMAAKAHILGTAFLGLEMKCARCHDAPHHSYRQEDLFRIAAMLRREPQEVPATSSVPGTAEDLESLIVEVSLEPGTKVTPDWPFDWIASSDSAAPLAGRPDDSRELLAAIITGPRNQRFAQVIANRMWKRYLGWGLVEPVEDWENATPSHPDLLAYLGRELIAADYDLKKLARLILNSQVYQRQAAGSERAVPSPAERLFAGPARRRLSAEQLVDSLFHVSGLDFGCESLNLDVDGRRPMKDFLNLGVPTRAWEFVSLSNERDRPALSLPGAQSIVDVLKAFGWREARQDPITVRKDVPTVIQPLTVSGGVVTRRVSTLSDGSRLTQAALVERPVERLVEETFIRLLTRQPTTAERETFGALLAAGYAGRRVEPRESSPRAAVKRARHSVSWSNHLSAEATRIKLALERAVSAGDAPTRRLNPDWRERLEDAIWALINSPEFLFIP